MRRKNQYRFSILAMACGLLLLAAFLGFWLKQNWDKEEQRFGEYIDHKVEMTVQMVEDSISTIRVVKRIDSTDSIDQSFTITVKSTRVEPYYINNFNQLLIEENNKGPVVVINTQDSPDDENQEPKENELLEQRIVYMNNIALAIDNIKSAPLGMEEPLDSILQKYTSNLDLNQDYPSAIFIAIDSLQASEDFNAGISRAFVYGKDKVLFAAQFPNYHLYLFRQILPHVLFSFLLLGLLGIAFYLINRSLLEQERLSKIKNDFISNITHELKTPITTVSVALEALDSFNAIDNPERSKEYIKISKGELNRLSILVDNVLKMSIFEEKQPVFKKENLDLKLICKGVLDSMQLQFEKKGASVDFEANGTSFLAKADKVHFTNVVYNLIENALKYNDKTPHIQVHLNDSARHIHIELRDNGIGIPKEYQDKVFEKFFRVPSGDTHNYKGHGLGLTYVANVVEAHGGIIDINSEVRKGTTFKITIPKIQN